jgi:hypothetical protein
MSLVSLIKDPDLIKKLEGIKSYVNKNLLRFWQIHSPHFVDHGEVHCGNIESLLYRIIPSNIREKMSEYEAFLLLCGAWLHDIGMLSRQPGESDEQVRETHHKRSRELIRKELPEIDLTEDERYIVGEIAFFHRKIEDINFAKEIFETQISSSIVSKVRVRFLCALVRLADGCEIAHSRSSRKLVKIASLDEEAKFHHEAHLHVSAIDFDHVSHEITVYVRVKHQEDALILINFLKSNIEKELFSVKNVLGENGIELSSVKIDVTIDSLAEELPQSKSKPNLMSLEQKVVEMEKRTGYYPSMVIDTKPQIHIFYETIAQTTKELQGEIISVLEEVGHLFSEKAKIIVTLNRIHDLNGTASGFGVEIVTVVAETKDFEEYAKSIIDKKEFWSRLGFFRRAGNDVFYSTKVPLSWKLAL